MQMVPTTLRYYEDNMVFEGLFGNVNNKLEGEADTLKGRQSVCKKCEYTIPMTKANKLYYICPKCGYYNTISARRRIIMLVDKRSFYEHNRELESSNILGFPGYEEKLAKAKKVTGENESVITGVATIGGMPVCIFAMESDFIMGSLGSVCGEKLTALFEYATENSLPVIGVTVSGGARMQEGMISLMQMSRVSAAVKKHSDAGNLYIVLLTNPTTGGVNASFAMLGDIIMAEPGARVGFAGPRVIEKTLNCKLPEDFQKAERVQECGFIDMIVPRAEQKERIAAILRLHGGNGESI